MDLVLLYGVDVVLVCCGMVLYGIGHLLVMFRCGFNMVLIWT